VSLILFRTFEGVDEKHCAGMPQKLKRAFDSRAHISLQYNDFLAMIEVPSNVRVSGGGRGSGEVIVEPLNEVGFPCSYEEDLDPEAFKPYRSFFYPNLQNLT
jgi:hypothetical protein